MNHAINCFITLDLNNFINSGTTGSEMLTSQSVCVLWCQLNKSKNKNNKCEMHFEYKSQGRVTISLLNEVGIRG